MKIPFIDLKKQQENIKEDLHERILKVLDHGQYIMGPEVYEFEDKLKEFSNSKYVVSCSSGTDALILALLGLNLKPGQGVIVPSFTFTASAEVIPVLGGIPIFADVDKLSYNISSQSIEEAIKISSKKNINVVGIISVGLFGQPAEIDKINTIAAKNNLWVIDDAAQSFGATYKDKRVGTLSDVTCTSFFPAKPLGAYGDGGALFTNSKKIDEIARSCRVHGQGKDKYTNIRLGMTARLDTMQATILISKLSIFENELKLRQKIANQYSKNLRDYVKIPHIPNHIKSSWAQYTIQLPDHIDRGDLQLFLKDKNIPTSIYYPIPIHRLEPYKKYFLSDIDLSVTNMLSKTVLSLPMHPYLDNKTVKYISERVVEFINKHN